MDAVPRRQGQVRGQLTLLAIGRQHQPQLLSEVRLIDKPARRPPAGGQRQQRAVLAGRPKLDHRVPAAGRGLQPPRLQAGPRAGAGRHAGIPAGQVEGRERKQTQHGREGRGATPDAAKAAWDVAYACLDVCT